MTHERKPGPGPADDPDATGALFERWFRSEETAILNRLLRLARTIDRATTRTLRERETRLTLAEWRVLSRLVMLQKARIGEIASTALVDSAEVSRAVDRLEKRGLVRRDEDVGDRRRLRVISMTPDGEYLASIIGEERRRYFTDLLGILDGTERAHLLDMLTRLFAETERRSTADALLRRRPVGRPSPRHKRG